MESLPLRLPLALDPATETKVALKINLPDKVALAVTEGSAWGYLLERQVILRVPKLAEMPAAEQELLFATVDSNGRPLERTWRWFLAPSTSSRTDAVNLRTSTSEARRLAGSCSTGA